MGLNLDLVQMLGVPGVSICPKCKKAFSNRYNDYDVECGEPNTGRGFWTLHNYCPICEHEFIETFATHTARLSGELPDAIQKLLRWTPEDKTILSKNGSHFYESGDENAPFFSEAYLYNLLGKEDARTLRALLREALEVDREEF